MPRCGDCPLLIQGGILSNTKLSLDQLEFCACGCGRAWRFEESCKQNCLIKFRPGQCGDICSSTEESTNSSPLHCMLSRKYERTLTSIRLTEEGVSEVTIREERDNTLAMPYARMFVTCARPCNIEAREVKVCIREERDSSLAMTCARIFVKCARPCNIEEREVKV